MAETQVATVSDKVRFIESVFGRGNMARNGKNFAVWCPICAPRLKTKRKLVIRLSDDANHCWTCPWRARSLAPLLKRFAGRSELIRYRDTFMLPEVRKLWADKDEEEGEIKPELPEDFVLLPLANERDPDVRALLRYLADRKVTERDMWYHRLGVSNDHRWYRRVLIPSFDAVGDLNYFTGRAIDKKKRRYENDDVRRTSIVFNELNIDWNRQLVICEGPFDMMKCGDNSTCILGCSLNENHLLFDRIVTNDTPVALALDAEATNAVTTIARKLVEYDVSVSIVNTDGYADPGEMSKSAFREALAAARPYDRSDDLRGRIKRAAGVSLSW